MGQSEIAAQVLEGGMLSTVQDPGRKGHSAKGIPMNGAFDTVAFKTGNRLIGNSINAAGLEVLWGGLKVEFKAPLKIAVTGGDLGAVLDGQAISLWEQVEVRAGQVLAFKGRKTGLRAYVALAGGIDVPLFYDSRSTYLFGGRGGLDGRKLQKGDLIKTFTAGPSPGQDLKNPAETILPFYTGSPWRLRVVYGFQHDFFTEESLKILSSSKWTVSSQSNRMVLRIEGPPLQFKERNATGQNRELAGINPSNIPTEGNPPGCIQCPSGEGLVIFGPDGPCGGGYAKLGSIITADYFLLGQIMPGEEIEFQPVTLSQAYAALKERSPVL